MGDHTQNPLRKTKIKSKKYKARDLREMKIKKTVNEMSIVDCK